MKKERAHLLVRANVLKRYVATIHQRQHAGFADEEDELFWAELDERITAIVDDISCYLAYLDEEVAKVESGLATLTSLASFEEAVALKNYIEADTTLTLKNLTQARIDYEVVARKVQQLCRSLD
jgi:hypothetical protein